MSSSSRIRRIRRCHIREKKRITFVGHALTQLIGYAFPIREREFPCFVTVQKRRKAFKVSSFGPSLESSASSSSRTRRVRWCRFCYRPHPESFSEPLLFCSKPCSRMSTPSSLDSISPEPALSNRSKASWISCYCSSVRSLCFLPPAATKSIVNNDACGHLIKTHVPTQCANKLLHTRCSLRARTAQPTDQHSHANKNDIAVKFF